MFSIFSNMLKRAKAVEAVKEQRAADFLRMLDEKAHQFIEARAGQPVSKLSDYESFMSMGTGGVWATARAGHLTASTVASARFYVEDSRTLQPAPDTDPLALLISQPNDYDSWEEILYMTVLHIKLVGCAYWLKDEVNGAGQPVSIYPLLPQFVKITPDKDTRVSEFIYSVSGTEVKIPFDQIIHFRRPHPSSFIFGLGDVEGGQALYNSYMNRSALEDKFLANGAQPSGVLTKKEEVMDETQWEAFKKKFNLNYAGRANAGKVAFLNGDWSYVKMGLTQQEMQAIEKEKWNIEQIFLNHGIPLSVAGLRDSANYATAKVEDMAFRRYECLPLLRLISGKLNGKNGLSFAYSETLKVRFELSGLVDLEQINKDYGPLVDRGVMTLNEMREKAGLLKAPDPLLDMYYVNNNRVPLELSGMSSPGDDLGEAPLPGEAPPAPGADADADESDAPDPPEPPPPPKAKPKK